MDCIWKPNWSETKQHLIDWWNHKGLVLGTWGAVESDNRNELFESPGKAPSIEYYYTEPEWRARWNHHELARQSFPADVLPIADTDIGPGSLALLIGSEPRFAEDTVWFEPRIDPDDPESHPPLCFDPDNRWWQITEATLRACAELGRGKYLIGCPDLIENIDIIAAMRDPQRLLTDMIDRPDWVIEKVDEINKVWFEAYDRIYDIIKLNDDSSTFGAFRLWGPGKVAKVQCDASAMFSPRMFERFVVPALTGQCEWLDYSMFHLDGHQCIRHLGLLLDIEALDAVEWTPDPQVPPGGSPEWYPLYRRILDAGKSVQAIDVQPDEIEPLLDAVGGKGMYIMTSFENEAEVERLLKIVEPYG